LPAPDGATTTSGPPELSRSSNRATSSTAVTEVEMLVARGLIHTSVVRRMRHKLDGRLPLAVITHLPQVTGSRATKADSNV
jgi:hypothetical protein